MIATAGFPTKLALLNPFASKVYAMRFSKLAKIDVTKPVDTSETRGDFLMSQLLDHTTSSEGNDAILMAAVYVKIPDDVPRWWDQLFRKAIVDCRLDGEPVVEKNRPAIQHMVVDIGQMPDAFCLAQPEPNRSSLFLGVTHHSKELAGPYDLRGYFLPNGSRVQLQLSGIPTGAGRLEIRVGAVAAVYTKNE